MEVALEAGADDVITDDDGAIEVLSTPADFEAVQGGARSRRPASPTLAEVTMRPENTVALAGDDARGCRSCSTSSRTSTTCRRVYHNAEIGRLKVLVIGGGGREHALAWKLAQSPRVQTVFVAPGNAGTAAEPRVTNVAITDLAELADFALAEKIALTVVGPEAALAAGVVDVFRAAGLRIFGPTQAAAQLESSKAFAKDFMQRHGIPTAGYEIFADAAAAHAHVDAATRADRRQGRRPGGGQGRRRRDDARRGARRDRRRCSAARHRPAAASSSRSSSPARRRASSSCATARSVLALATSQDHKRLGDGDIGPNTGGMGAYSPAPVVTPNVHARVDARDRRCRRSPAWPPKASRSAASSMPA